jgi:putative oxidoreductase
MIGKKMNFINLSISKKLLQDVLLLFIRIWIANIFLRSGLLKIFSWDSTIYLFTNEYNVPLLPPELAAIIGTANEICAGVAILIGFGTRFAAIALLCLSAVIEIFVYPGTQEHYYWMILLSILISFGAGRFSLFAIGQFVHCKTKTFP